jgi:glycosyltransferase involved in cell wall biosynthesis
MLVSIVTPSYNQSRYLEAAICSVLEQDYPTLEYLVVDGGSTDDSTAIIHRYANRLTWWVSELDQGQADGINKGLRRAKGEVVAWLNSDDLYLPGAISCAVKTFETHPQIGMIFGDLLAINADGQPINLQRFGDWGLRELMSFHIIGQPAVFMRRGLLEQAGYLDPSYHLLLDHHLWIRMALLSEIYHVPETLAAARFHPQAKNTVHAAAFGQEALRIVDWMRLQPALAPLVTQNEKRILAGAYRLNAYYLVDGDLPAAALSAYVHAFKYHPSTALMDWRRILLAILSMIGLDHLVRGAYIRLRSFHLRHLLSS